MTPPRILLAALTLVLATALVVGVATLVRDDPAPRRAAAVVGARPEVAARAVLGEWDARRAEAWAAGDVPGLRDLYIAGSSAGRRDARMLRRWVRRGLVVQGLTTQVHALRVTASGAGRWEVEVTDRVLGGVAVGPGTRTPLPADAPTTRALSLVETEQGWRVEAVRSLS